MSGAHKNRAARDPRQSAEWVGLLRFAFRIAGMAGLLVACVGLVLVDPAASLPQAAKRLISEIGAFSGAGTSVLLSATGANTYSWSNGETTTFIDSLIAGNYSVSVTDNSNCEV